MSGSEAIQQVNVWSAVSARSAEVGQRERYGRETGLNAARSVGARGTDATEGAREGQPGTDPVSFVDLVGRKEIPPKERVM